MTYKYKFDKILTLREKEKKDMQAKYSEAVKRFETVAEELYMLLKKKETLLDEQQEKMLEGLSVLQIRHNQTFMGNLEKKIEFVQQEVINARQQMDLLQRVLIDKNIEVKKYEKMQEKDYAKHLQFVKHVESNQMDDLSIQTFLSKEIW